MKKIWDLERLISDADSFRIVERLGIEKRRYGATTYVRCPSGTHPETRLTHAKLFRNGCKCFSCGNSYSSYGMVKAYCENILGTGISHDEICSILAESAGADDSEYIIRNDKGNTKKRFPLSKEELILIGLEPKPASRVIVSYSDSRDNEHTEPVDGGYAKKSPITGMSIFYLFKEDEDIFWEMVKGKTDEAYKRSVKWAIDTILDIPLKDLKIYSRGLLKPGFDRYFQLKKFRDSLPSRIRASKKNRPFKKAA